MAVMLAKLGDAESLSRAMPSFLAAVRSDDAGMRYRAAAALAWIAKQIEDKSLLRDAVPALTRALKDENEQVRAEVEQAMRELGEVQ